MAEDIEEIDKEEIEGEKCVLCGEEDVTLAETVMDIPHFGKCHLLTMNCDNCGYSTSDIEAEEEREGMKYTLKVESEDDLNIRIVKSSQGSLKISRMGSVDPGENSTGYITTVESVLEDFKKVLKGLKDEADEKKERKKLKNRIKKINRTIWGRDSVKIKLEDETGNSAILSDKAETKKL